MQRESRFFIKSGTFFATSVKNHANAFGYRRIFAAVRVIDTICRYVAVLLMLGVFFTQTFSNAVIMGNYYLNTTAFAKNCENKDKPWLHCNGKCQMRKQIQQEDKKDQDNPERKSDNKNEVTLSSKSFFATANHLGVVVNTKLYIAPRSIGRSTDRSFSIFHPPQA